MLPGIGFTACNRGIDLGWRFGVRGMVNSPKSFGLIKQTLLQECI